MKVIFINTYNDYGKDIGLYYPGTEAFFTFGMGQFIAREFYSRGYPVSFENWRMDLRIDGVMEKEISRVICRIFPSKKLKYFGEYSKEFKNELKKEAAKQNTVFHFMGNHKLNYHYFAWLAKKRRVIATHLGGANPFWNYKNEGNIKSLIYYILERYIFLKPYNCFISICKAEVDYYNKVKKRIVHMPILGIPIPETLIINSRTNCRDKLGLPLDKKIILQVGRATKERGFDWVIKLLDHYKKKNDYYLIFVGIHKEDEFYSELTKRDIYVKGYLTRQELIEFYNASDLLYYLPHGDMDLNFAGTSYVPLESLACGTPVVSTTFHHFPGHEANEVSRTPHKYSDVIPMIEDLLKVNVSRQRCREIVLKYFSWDPIVQKYWEIYSN